MIDIKIKSKLTPKNPYKNRVFLPNLSIIKITAKGIIIFAETNMFENKIAV